ncbi:multidrug transporter [Marinobacter flavimaris]|jgi:multidrug efflux system outer membrane protein|uniref:Multidrug transporter n=1 Tax=Marinobacter flavimaris TaxID=262076 RepID=A0A3D8GXR1_9GAMM|nr:MULTISPECIES: efflux transporter outer membrane subunit [Marinobacter]MBO6812106.1 efflux transporter outer membrane subunit [Marinobacter sp.]MBO6873646.1 efflux transporter outer membrane subunit [Marinobacter sp.]PPI78625.1 multidrug transporter [Marinobacter flavimaris]RDU39248.1 multidrug transporter [Marinobacter flavimaris]ROQ42684.1 multidrug efflux system outer membrane protein [Marinobacter sp. 3-2]|tara:strand:+ start:9377 stop:10810 length:1434 start_codon:yes stop_codon:yes gene_type:complete
MSKRTLIAFSRASLIALWSAAWLAGCSLAPSFSTPEAPIASDWGSESSAAKPGTAVESSSASLDWRTFVVNEQLQGLIETALANNRDLRQALLSVEAARAQYGIQRSDQLPTLQVEGSGQRERVPGDLSASGRSTTQSLYQAGVGLTTYELDLFGRVENLSEAALQEFLATEEGARSTRISLISNIVRTYVIRDGALERKRLAKQVLNTREASLQLIADRLELGAATALDYQEALGLVEQTRVDLERVEREIRQTTNALTLLVGVPDVRPQLSEEPTSDRWIVQGLAPGAPSELLEHRPDIRAAEHRLRSRNANIGAARAAFFPRFSLTGSFGSASAELSDLFGSGQESWSFAPRLTLPIFDGGRNEANLDLAHVRKDLAVAEYEKVIQSAFREVSDAIAAKETLQRETAARQSLVKTSEMRLQLSRARYENGADDYSRYLDAQRQSFRNRSALVQVQTEQQLALADLFRALGGGWQ